MPRGKIKINEDNCKSCKLCVHFCSKDCIEMSGDRFNANGYLLPAFVNEDDCIGCGICGWMCPECIIDVFKYVEN